MNQKELNQFVHVLRTSLISSRKNYSRRVPYGNFKIYFRWRGKYPILRAYRRRLGKYPYNIEKTVTKNGNGTTENHRALTFKTKAFPSGKLDIRLEVNKGMIEETKIFGDFFGMEDVEEIEQRLVGVRYAYKDIEEALADVDISRYFGGVTMDDFYN